jgi:hypothetical protein
VKPEKMIEDYVNANQSSLRSLLRDMSSRKMEKPVIDQNKRNPKINVANSYLKGYGRNKSTFTSVRSPATSQVGGGKAKPFVPPLGHITDYS